MDGHEDFGAWLRATRETLAIDGKRMTQAEIAAGLGVPRQTVAMWETGQRRPIGLYLERVRRYARRRNLPPPPAIDRSRPPRRPAELPENRPRKGVDT